MAKRKKILLFAWLFAIFSCFYGQTYCYAQNFWERLTGSNKPKTENIKSNDNQKSNKKKQNIPETDPLDYSLDENLLVPAVPQKPGT